MLHCCFRTRRYLRFPLPRPFSSSGPPFQNSAQPPNPLINTQQVAQPPVLHRDHDANHLSPLPTRSLSRNSVLAISAAFVSALVASYALLSSDHNSEHESPNPLYAGAEHAIQTSSDSFKNLFHHVKQTGVAASILWQSLRSVLSSANHEVRSGFELRVAALLADIAAANGSRRAAIVGAGGGAVVDWLLESVAVPRDGCGTQAESARALAYLIADPNVCTAVIGRPHAIPNLLRFIFSSHPQRSKQQSRRSSFDVSDSLKGRSMLVAAIMDMVTSSCDGLDKVSFQPSLPGNAETGDIAAALQVVEEGGMHLDESDRKEDDEDGGNGLKGIGIKILGGTSVMGLSRSIGLMKLGHSDASHEESIRHTSQVFVLQNRHDGLLLQTNLASAVVPGLWDDLHCEHVAVPFATWALANWATASEVNRSHIQILDQDGQAVMTALVAPERSVKWHGSLVARLLLEDRNLSLSDSVSDWSYSLLSTVSQASKNEDIPLAQVALSAFMVSVERSRNAKKIVMEKGLHLLRDTAKRMTMHNHVQDTLSKALELLCTGDMHLSLEESQKWSGILLRWVFGKDSSDTVRSSAIKILSCILEDYGPSTVLISQAWLAIILSEILASTKTSTVKESSQPKSDKVKTQIDQSKVHSAAQTANQLLGSVVNLAGNQLATGSVDALPLADLLSLEPFMGSLKNLKKDSLAKFDAADSALATLKGIKALTEISAEDSMYQEKITAFGILCLLRRFLLSDDYEKLAAIEAYDACKAFEAQERVPNGPGETAISDTNDSSSIRVPPTAHIRRHAARLLTILSLLPKVQKLVLADETWCKWLEDCANGKIPGCSDLKIQSYARATLLNIFCNNQVDRDSVNRNLPDTSNKSKKCPQYGDMIFLINPEKPHWKCPEDVDEDTVRREKSSLAEANTVASEITPVNPPRNDDNCSSSVDVSNSGSQPEPPLLDVVFIHGIRGGAYRSWRMADNKSSTTSGLVEKIDQEAGKLGTFWPGEWLSSDFPQARMFTIKYKTNITKWAGASLPLQEVSSMLFEKLVAAGIGNRPVVFVTHSMGGLVVKQMLYKAKAENFDNLVNNTIGVVFYSCPHFGSKLADMPWRMGLVFRRGPTIGELRSGSPILIELNDFFRHLNKKGMLDVLSFCETKVTPIVEGYGGWAFRMEVVPIESAYPGFGELVVLESTDHINSCKPISRSDPSYKETLEFLRKMKARYT
ncbi:hypothetical protein F2P56_034069 [Juglans regia]|uniref:Protein SERAC1 n=3 Tax=Juglans regia TaxID=51240 RepID=A0A833TXF0_JUGRE|nr:uncharacterized protein LOC108992351 isoform X1 [Juglans regia]KAF5444978.1 hypothetical protein F2P56_034069 [Juglans regia]